MRITTELLPDYDECADQVAIFKRLWPKGCRPTIENLVEAEANKLHWLWCIRLLPLEGPGSQREFGLWCAEQAAYLIKDQRIHNCLRIIATRVKDPTSVLDKELSAIEDVAAAVITTGNTSAAWNAVTAAATIEDVTAGAGAAAAWNVVAAANATGARIEAAVWNAAVTATRAAEQVKLSSMLLGTELLTEDAEEMKIES